MAGRLVTQVREFNRFYTRVIGVLEAGIAGTPYSLTEARVLYELAGRDEVAVADLRRDLGIDAGYLSRLLARFAADGLVARETSTSDGRRQIARLTEHGAAAYAMVDAQQVEAVERLLEPLGEQARQRLVAAMDVIRRSLGGASRPEYLVLRAPGPGELGWIVSRHGAFAASERGRPEVEEARAARIVAGFAERRDRHEAAWVAEADGEPVGCVLCLAGEDPRTASLRLLLVEPHARGAGIGGRLVEECVRFARTAGYARLRAATAPRLVAAERLLARSGFTREEALEGAAPDDGAEQIWTRSLGGSDVRLGR
jgi:DNA-binding MarR family transcriptional regulator/GNAT superfamily N-acetyltransferase